MKRWTPEEENELRELYGTMTAEALAVRFGTTYRAIYQKCNKMGLKKDQPCKIHLTPQQELWMKIHWPHMSNEIAPLYSVSAIVQLSGRRAVSDCKRPSNS